MPTTASRPKPAQAPRKMAANAPAAGSEGVVGVAPAPAARMATPRLARPSEDTPSAPLARRPSSSMEMTMVDQANKAAETMMKAAEDMAEFGRGNVEAMTKAAQLYVSGVQDLGKHTVSVMQGLTDHALEGAKALATVKSLQEAAQVQTTYARGAFEKVVAESTKFQEAALKLAEQSFAPLTARMTVAVEKLSRPSLAA